MAEYTLTQLRGFDDSMIAGLKPIGVSQEDGTGHVLWREELRAWGSLMPAIARHLGERFVRRLHEGALPEYARVFTMDARELPQANLKRIIVHGEVVWCNANLPGPRAIHGARVLVEALGIPSDRIQITVVERQHHAYRGRRAAAQPDPAAPPQGVDAVALQGMSSPQVADLERRLLEELQAAGGSAGNKSLMRWLGWSDDVYWAVRSRLISDGRLAVGKGQGGSVHVVRPDTPCSWPADAQTSEDSDEPSGPSPFEAVGVLPFAYGEMALIEQVSSAVRAILTRPDLPAGDVMLLGMALVGLDRLPRRTSGLGVSICLTRGMESRTLSLSVALLESEFRIEACGVDGVPDGDGWSDTLFEVGATYRQCAGDYRRMGLRDWLSLLRGAASHPDWELTVESLGGPTRDGHAGSGSDEDPWQTTEDLLAGWINHATWFAGGDVDSES